MNKNTDGKISNSDFTVTSSEEKFVGNIIAVRRDCVKDPHGKTFTRDVVEHFGAVAVLAINDFGELALVNQYRHPLQRTEWEIPAGLLDRDDRETPLEAAQRELQEEVGFASHDWGLLLDISTSPGIIDETVRVFVAQKIFPVEQPELHEEEAFMTVHWTKVDDALQMIQRGQITNGTAMAAILAYVQFAPALLRNPREKFHYQPHALHERKRQTG